MVYLICFDRKYKHAQHYIGFATSEHTFEKRIECHRKGRGAKLLDVLNKAGIGWKVVRTWPDGDRNFERKLKNQKKSSALCPHCKAAKKAAAKCPVINRAERERVLAREKEVIKKLNAPPMPIVDIRNEVVVTPASQPALAQDAVNEMIAKAKELYGEPKSQVSPSRWSRLRNTLARFWQFLTS